MDTTHIIASIALIISLISIWQKNRGLCQQLLVTNISTYTKRYQEILEKMPKSVIENDFDLNSFPEDEKEKLLRSMWLYFDLCYEEYILYHELKLIGKKLWKIWEKSIFSAFARPAFYQCWNVIYDQSSYPPPFSKFVKDKMLELHRPGRRIIS